MKRQTFLDQANQLQLTAPFQIQKFAAILCASSIALASVLATSSGAASVGSTKIEWISLKPMKPSRRFI